ncbi:hypothetical protein [Brevibacterium sp. XM4083]|uniref:hypothetical protein n=1 Tax=Brevibacterium sp. XM4083 TaxID=2583238 RepID=UPI00112D0269|nr:hypothetical protein [Brevibacterium sp. XM4083]MCM1011901.1 hypothetical protein [Brevibacterium sp. XM4083]
MSLLALTDAIEALFPEDTHFEAVKPNEKGQYLDTLFPWTVARVQIPNTRSRSLARTRLGQRVRVKVTVAGITYTSVRTIVANLDPHIQGARPIAEGWSTSPLDLVNAREIAEDDSMTLTTANRHPVFTVLEYELTATQH